MCPIYQGCRAFTFALARLCCLTLSGLSIRYERRLYYVYYVLGCITWTRITNTAASNGVFYGLAAESTCMNACLRSPSCAAVDLGPVGCVLHNVSDLTTTYYAAGITHFILNRNCLSPSPLTTERPFISTTSDVVTTARSVPIVVTANTPAARATETTPAVIADYLTETPGTVLISFLPRDATQSAVMPQYIVCLSVCP